MTDLTVTPPITADSPAADRRRAEEAVARMDEALAALRLQRERARKAQGSGEAPPARPVDEERR